MADLLTADQLSAAAERNLRWEIIRTANIDNAAITLTDISDKVASWGQIKFEVYNRHPSERGNLWFPVCSISVKNADKAFDRGGIFFPNGTDDFASTTLRVQISIDFGPAGIKQVLDFTGNVREPEYDPTGYVNLVAEHPLTAINNRKWVREDRIGGNTGIGAFFNS